MRVDSSKIQALTADPFFAQSIALSMRETIKAPTGRNPAGSAIHAYTIFSMHAHPSHAHLPVIQDVSNYTDLNIITDFEELNNKNLCYFFT